MTSLVRDPTSFKDHLRVLMNGTEGLLSDCVPIGGSPFDVEAPFCFALAANQERPREFLQSLLDLLRTTFEPQPPGTFQLNSNWDFVHDSVPEVPFRLGYLSVQGGPGESVTELADKEVRSRMKAHGYSFADAFASFVCVSVGRDLFSLRVNAEISRAFNTGFSVSQARSALADAAAGSEFSSPAGFVCAGLALDETLSNGRMRISCWFFMPSQSGHQELTRAPIV